MFSTLNSRLLHRSFLMRLLQTTGLSLALMTASAAGVRAEDVTVQGAPGVDGADGVNPGDLGRRGRPRRARNRRRQTAPIRLNKATAIGGNGGRRWKWRRRHTTATRRRRRKWRRRESDGGDAPSSQARQRRTLNQSAELGGTTARERRQRLAARQWRKRRICIRHSRRPDREMAMLRLRLRRRAVQAALTDLERTLAAPAATPAPAALPQLRVLARVVVRDRHGRHRRRWHG